MPTPLASNADQGPATEDEAVLDADGHFIFRAVIGGLFQLAVSTRPELSKPVGSLAQQMHAPTPRHLTFEQRTLVPDRQRPCRHSLEHNGPMNPSCFVADVDVPGAVTRISVVQKPGM